MVLLKAPNTIERLKHTELFCSCCRLASISVVFNYGLCKCTSVEPNVQGSIHTWISVFTETTEHWKKRLRTSKWLAQVINYDLAINNVFCQNHWTLKIILKSTKWIYSRCQCARTCAHTSLTKPRIVQNRPESNTVGVFITLGVIWYFDILIFVLKGFGICFNQSVFSWKV